MILGIKKLHELVKEIKLVENLCDRELNNPEGAGFDLRLGEVHEIQGEGFLGLEQRHTPDAKLLAQYDPNKKDEENYFVFAPGKYYLIKTIEKVNLPINLAGIIHPRTTMYRSGLGFFNGIASPGYCGELVFSVYNFHNQPIKVSLGARVAHITFHEVLGEGNQYRGQWQGGRVTTDGKEKQV
ncbi:MAG: hypothetical protein NTW06_03115 [Candidatus Falkowbacteria bacterium]|nr:hypothetical protein [Candidatus Falkowbacteria bacterium]